MEKEIFRVVDCEGRPANSRNNRRKNTYKSYAHAQSAATQFNNTRVWDSRNVRDVQLPDAPYRVQRGVVVWEDVE